MIVYTVNGSIWETEPTTIAVFSTLEKAEEAKAQYKKEFPNFEYSIEEFELDKR